ncbi:MAG: GNAT family N-acetyltransferase [Lachnospiraceae bacterium]|nr:GNAT family N-acetyltransferase [Lachnospiraceae bacterium]
MVLLVIDTQKGITDDRLYEFEKVTKNIKELIDLARTNHKKVIFVQHDDGPGTGFSYGDEEFEIYDDFAPQEGEWRFVKTVNSALHPSVGLIDELRNLGERDLMIVGLQTNYCIDATIKTGFDNGFKMIVPEFTNSTFDSEYMDKETCYKYYNESMWPGRLATCVSMEEARTLLKEDYSDFSIETEDLILRKARPEDWKDMYENLWSHSESARYMRWAVTTSEEAAKERAVRSADFQRNKKYAFFIQEKVSGKAIGFAGMTEESDGVYDETGIAIGPDYVGKGYGKQVLKALIKEAFENCGAKEFYASNWTQNEVSRKLQESLGFEFSHKEFKTHPETGEEYILEHRVLKR